MKITKLKTTIAIYLVVLIMTIVMSGCTTTNDNFVSGSQDSNFEKDLLVQEDSQYSSYTDGETNNKIDLSQYTNHGEFSDDGIMWVEKSDYTGVQYGYIDYSGNFIIPLTSEIAKPGEFKNGYVSIIYNYDQVHCNCGFLNKKGELLFEYKHYSKHAYDRHITYIDKGIIAFEDIKLNNSDYCDYIYLTDTNKFIDISRFSYYPEYISFSEGWIRTMAKKDGVYPYVEYYNMNGELELKIDENSNEYYKLIYYVGDFINGKSTLKFIGLDNKCYLVTIDKSGNWLDEPILSGENSDESFFD